MWPHVYTDVGGRATGAVGKIKISKDIIRVYTCTLLNSASFCVIGDLCFRYVCMPESADGLAVCNASGCTCVWPR